DHLVRRGVPFRESHHIAGALVRMAEESGRKLSALTLDEMRSVHPGFGEDVYRIFDPAASVESRAVRGGTSARAVQTQLDALARALSSTSGTA
ncbi:MAG: argininosuccinate lyase, partial [Gemmatimonadota bacterium]|nr:argininosuccinate lyase [Gemmatimonadota bacterium]